MAFKSQYTMCLLIFAVIISTTFCMPPPLPTTPPTTTKAGCPPLVNQDECRPQFCINGAWAYFETITSRECCVKYIRPHCLELFPDLFTPPPPTTTRPPPPTTTKAGCPQNANLDKCTIWDCINGVWSPFESIISKECCLKHHSPRCLEVFPELYTPPPKPMPPTTTTKAGCPQNANLDKCTVWGCINGVWSPFEPIVSEECCLKHHSPMCLEVFPELYNAPPTPPKTTRAPAPLCKAGTKLVKGCTVYLCSEGRWKEYEVHLTKECCYENRQQPGCDKLLSPVEPQCKLGSKLVKGCIVYLCIEGRWEKHEVHLTKECCSKYRRQPGCDRLLSQVEVKVEPICKEGEDKRVDHCIIHVCIDGQWRKHGYYASYDCCQKDKTQKVCQQLF